jgi:PHP family Zn ribbon phosphoesterase
MQVQSLWRQFVERFGSEINALLEAPFKELSGVNARAAAKINAFRQGWVHYIPGGGGNYGKPIICNSLEEFERKAAELGEQLECSSASRWQSTLKEFQR